MKPIGIIIPTRWEAGPVLEALAFKRIEKDLYKTQLGDKIILLCISGIGMESARNAAYRLCAQGVGCLISAGFCGALSPGLKVGDLITDRIVTSPVLLRTLEERRAVAQKAGAVAVDMETQAIIEAGTRRGVPIRVLRVISDRLDDDLAPLFAPYGFSPLSVAFRLLNPFAWPLALRLGRQSAFAKTKLVQAITEYLKGSYEAFQNK